MVKKSILFIFIIILLSYFTLLLSTNSLIEDFYDVTHNNKSEEVDYGQLERYSIPEYVQYNNIKTNIQRLFVIHSFRKGILWVKYSCIAYDENDKTVAGSTNIISQWYIEKRNGRWKVIKIKEKP